MRSHDTTPFAQTTPDGAVRLITSTGSLMLELGAVPDMIQADAAFLADVSAEIGRVRRGSPSLAVVLGRGDTTPTLFDRAMQSIPPSVKCATRWPRLTSRTDSG
jgi:hypothetical protein